MEKKYKLQFLDEELFQQFKIILSFESEINEQFCLIYNNIEKINIDRKKLEELGLKEEKHFLI